MELLLNMEYEVSGNWNAPTRFLKTLPEVVDVEIINNSSSAGDWDGMLFQEKDGKIYSIPFSQENNYPSAGFSIYTDADFEDVCALNEWCEEIKSEMIFEYTSLYY